MCSLTTRIGCAFNGIYIDIPRLPIDEVIEDPNADEDKVDPNDRRPMRLLDARIQRDDEYSDSDDEGPNGAPSTGWRRNEARHRDGDNVTLSPGERRRVGVGIMGGAGGTGVGSTTTHTPNVLSTSSSEAAKGKQKEKETNTEADETMDVDAEETNGDKDSDPQILNGHGAVEKEDPPKNEVRATTPTPVASDTVVTAPPADDKMPIDPPEKSDSGAIVPPSS